MHSGAKCTRKKKLQIIDNNVIIITEWRAREEERKHKGEGERERKGKREKDREREGKCGMERKRKMERMLDDQHIARLD